jgi:hypothetical protein
MDVVVVFMAPKIGVVPGYFTAMPDSQDHHPFTVGADSLLRRNTFRQDQLGGIVQCIFHGLNPNP